MTLKSKLIQMSACSEAVEWVGRKSLKTAWAECERGDWMLWLAACVDIDRKLLVLAACDCADTALQYVPKGDNRPAKAIQAARSWCAGMASLDDVRKARAAAEAARAAGAAGAAAWAAEAAARTAARTAAWAAAGAAGAAEAAEAAAGAAARTAAMAATADLVRARIPYTVINKALKAMS